MPASLARSPTALVTTLLLSVCAGVRLRAQCPDGTPPPCGRAVVRTPAPNSLAVLAFANADDDSALAWLGGGLAEEVATELASARGLAVRGASIVRNAQRVAQDDARRVAQLVAVHYVVEGSYRSAGHRVRVSARVLVLPSGDTRWGKVYDRARDSLATLSDEIARDVAALLSAASAPSAAAARRTTNAVAYEAYQRGRYAFRSGDPPRARREFGLAIRLDSGFARAWAGSAMAVSEEADAWLPPREAFPLARASARHALSLDSSIAEAYLAQVWAAGGLDHDCRAGQRLADRAIAIDSGLPDAWSLRSAMLLCQGADSLGIAAAEHGFGLDSLSAYTSLFVLYAYVWTRRPAPPEVLDRLRGNISPDLGAFLDGMLAMEHGDCTAAERVLRPYAGSNLGERYPAALVCLGRRAEADSIVRAFMADTLKGYVNGEAIAQGLLAIGDREGSLAWLQRAFDEGTWWEMNVTVDPAYDTLRGDPRFQALMRRLRFP